MFAFPMHVTGVYNMYVHAYLTGSLQVFMSANI